MPGFLLKKIIFLNLLLFFGRYDIIKIVLIICDGEVSFRMKISQKARSAIFLGTLCSVSYLAVYIARNILGVVTPYMEADGINGDFLGLVFSVYSVSYAIGQLINGAIGNRIKAKYMISAGLLLAGISSFVFSALVATSAMAIVAYAMTGFFLSMIYGPMTKVVSESTELIYATRCSLGYTFSSFFGSPMAGVLATCFTWQTTFAVSSATLVAMAVLCFGCFLVFERKGIVKYPPRIKKSDVKLENNVGIKGLFKHKIVKFSIIAMITGVIRSSFVVFFLTSYFAEYLGFVNEKASSTYSVVTLFISFTAFIAVFVYEKLMKKNMHTCVLLFFSLAALCFLLSYFAKGVYVNIAFILLGIMSSNSASSVLWSIYCPSLKDTGLVSGATGFLDFLSYMSAAAATLVIGAVKAASGWSAVIILLIALMAVGIIISLPYDRIFKKAEKGDINNA